MTAVPPLRDDPVVLAVREAPGSIARDVGDAIGIDRRDAVGLLNEHFGQCLFQDNRYRWWPDEENIAEQDSGGEEGEVDASLTDGIDPRALARYYLEAVISDSRDNVSVYARSRDPQYVVVERHPIADGTYAMPRDQNAGFANRAFKEKKRLSIGGPVYADFVPRKSGRGGDIKLKPLFTWTIQPGAGEIEVIASSIAVNADVLAALGGERRADPEQVVSLQTNLGLDRPDELPPFDEVMARLVSLYPAWPWAELTDPMTLGTQPALHQLDSRSQEGIYNRVVLTAVDGPTYTRGLETELAAISEASPASFVGTALERVVSGPDEGSMTGVPSLEDELIEPLPLNSEQRDAVTAALTSGLTVVTGPPGTGKSQVVSSIIINAAYRGQSVLFASKNNKAVDVVEARINALSRRPALLRLGAQHLDTLTGYLTSLLAMPASRAAEQEHEAVRVRLAVIDGRIKDLEQEIEGIVLARNATDQLDADAEEARGTLPSSLRGSSESFDKALARTAIDRYVDRAQSADRSRQSGFVHLFWFATQRRRSEDFASAIPPLTAVAKSLGVETPPPTGGADAAEEFAARLRERIDLLLVLQRFEDAAHLLSASERIENLYARRAELVIGRSSVSREVWDTWVGTLRSGITKQQQADLGTLKSVASALASGPWSPNLANRFQKLFASVKQFLPAWAITSLSVRGRVPLQPQTFDLVVIDEASQCDIASAIPLLYRAKRAVIIGDPMQLRHISGLNPREDENIRRKHGMRDRVEWSYATESLYDLGARVTDETVFLRDHHRSDRDIIEFSNGEFYDSLLRVATRYDQLVRPEPPVAVRWVQISGRFERPGGGGGRNEPEAGVVVGELVRLETQGYPGTVGVVTPFRAQANRIRQLAMKQLSPAFWGSAQIDIGTAHTFQGDERDVMIYSPVITEGAGRGALWFVGEQNKNLFNVAITRARSSLVVVGDRESGEMESLPTMKRFIDYVDSLAPGAHPVLNEIEDLGERYPEQFKGSRVSTWEHNLYEALYVEGLATTPQVEVDAYRLDLALYDSDRMLDIEIDGERYHAAWDGGYVYADRLRNMRMLELGWDVMRFWVWEVRDDLDGCVNRVKRWTEATS